MMLYNALLQEKKVMFLGHNLPSWTICRYVISSCLLLAPIHNVLIERAYPLTYLGGFGFQNSQVSFNNTEFLINRWFQIRLHCRS